MKFLFVFVALFAVALAAPSDDVVLKYDSDNIGVDGYNYAYETSNGIAAQEAGQLKDIGDEHVLNVQGSYSYTAPDGQSISVTYIADENGFQPQGAHLPVAGGGNGQMGTLGLESVLIGDVVDGVGLAIIGHKGEGTLDGEGLQFRASVLQLTLLLSSNTIAGLETVGEQGEGSVNDSGLVFSASVLQNTFLADAGAIASLHVGAPRVCIVIFESSTINNVFKMKFAIVLFALFAVALAAPSDVTVLRSDSEVGPLSYKFGSELSDGTKKDEEGQLKNVGSEQEAIVVHGSYSYVADDGQTYTVTYVADENGFQPQGAHLPVAPVA
ncbi:uncharacterized protein Dyak_GE28983 [Drosophila yakuba]|uniref:Uncharacterized protein n=1 Tax=Drosophila yakuba TaxID=7245 RepID=A0A0R1DVW0_DROYA|nr:uncharacterized protein Dyak_GE28983 [Drosophila yakuba]